MTRRALLVAVMLALTLAVPEVSSAQISVGIGSPSRGVILSETDVPFTETGSLVVTFAGSQAAGCAAVGVCAYSGRIDSLPVSGDVSIAKIRVGDHIRQEFGLGSSSDGIDPTTTAEVDRTLADGGVSRCADAIPFGGQLDAPSTQAGTLEVQLVGPSSDLLATRCAGPTDAELSDVSPRARLSIPVVKHGLTTIDLSGTSHFAVAGFAGELVSTIGLHLGKPQYQSFTRSSPLPKNLKFVSYRNLDEGVKLLSIRGSVRVGIAGTSDPTTCSLLDSCGIRGSATLLPQPRQGSGELEVLGRARVPIQRFRAGLGLAHSAQPLDMTGSVGWDDASQTTMTLVQSGNDCRGTTPEEGGSLELSATQGRARIVLSSQASLRSECPGPFLGPDSFAQLAVGNFRLAELRHRTVTVRVRALGPLTDDGYVMHPSGGLTVRLRLGRIKQFIFKAPPGLTL